MQASGLVMEQRTPACAAKFTTISGLQSAKILSMSALSARLPLMKVHWESLCSATLAAICSRRYYLMDTSQQSFMLSRPMICTGDMERKSSRTRLLPMKPAAPVTKIVCMIYISSYTSIILYNITALYFYLKISIFNNSVLYTLLFNVHSYSL